MGTSVFEASVVINQSADVIYAHLSDPQSYLGLSPLLTRIYDISNSHALAYPVIKYTTVERIRIMGLFAFDNPIQVALHLVESGHKLVHQVTARFGVSLVFVDTFYTEQNTTKLHEHVTAHAPRIVHDFVVSEAKKTQNTRLKRLKQRMEGLTFTN